MKYRPRNIWLAFRDQLPWKRLYRNLRSGNIRGLIHERSHLTHGGKPKVAYGSKKSSLEACEKMAEKTGNDFRSYKCLYCDGYHIGKNRNPNRVHPDEGKWNSEVSKDL